jgi:hypothetical protein
MEVFIELSDIKSPLQKIFVRATNFSPGAGDFTARSKKKCGTVASRPALRNHF